jgi:GNAT superfamily N-acetyltransferase
MLREIETSAGEAFRSVGLEAIADAEPMSVEVLDAYAIRGRSWVAVDEADCPVGYVVVDVVDGNAHVEQISVLAEHQGRGVGKDLLDTVRSWAFETGCTAITLTTFIDVPWNYPLYAHLGFVVLPEEELGPELRAVRQHEAEMGLDPVNRVCMRKESSISISLWTNSSAPTPAGKGQFSGPAIGGDSGDQPCGTAG